MSNLLQSSKAFSFAGTALLHLWIIQVCVFAVPQSKTKPLPPAEPVRIRLTEPSDASLQLPSPSLISRMPETKPIVQETSVPDITPPLQRLPVTQDESSASHLPEVQSKPERFSEVSHERALAPPTSAQHFEREAEARARMIEEAKQAVISALVASLEREKRYPTAAHRLGIEGQVMALVRVDSQGRIISTSTKNESEPMLERATLEALQRVQKRWVPMPLPEPMTLNIPIRYNLETRK